MTCGSFSVNAVNVLDNNMEGNAGIGIVANYGAGLRIEGNCMESQGGPAIVANEVRTASRKTEPLHVQIPFPGTCVLIGVSGHNELARLIGSPTPTDLPAHHPGQLFRSQQHAVK